jgi:hypothetical protein
MVVFIPDWRSNDNKRGSLLPFAAVDGPTPHEKGRFEIVSYREMGEESPVAERPRIRSREHCWISV